MRVFIWMFIREFLVFLFRLKAASFPNGPMWGPLFAL